MKTCVLITGTNASGKTALAWAIINKYGGVDRIANDVTYCKEGRVCLAGSYGVNRFCGVDRIANDNGSSCTSRLAQVVEEGLRNADTIICEGSFLNTFGLNLSNALFKGDRQLVVSLYSDVRTIYNRIIGRSNGMAGKRGKRNWVAIFKKQRGAMVAAQKWQQIGVPVLQFDTSQTTLEYELEAIIHRINEICTQ